MARIPPNPDDEALYGPAAPFSDHHIGERVRYRVGLDGDLREGDVLYVIAPHEVDGQHLPLTYVVDSGHGFPDMVWQPDIIQ